MQCCTVTPFIRIRLVLDVWPETISTLLRETSNVLARSFISSAFAAPSTGGEQRRTFKAPSSSPTISLFDARGATRTPKNTAPSFSSKLIKIVKSSPPHG
jgi:hypothetical protein